MHGQRNIKLQNLKLTQKFEQCVSRHTISKIWVTIQTVCDTKNNKMKYMNLVGNCDNGAGPFNYK